MVSALLLCLGGCSRVDANALLVEAGKAAAEGRFSDAIELTEQCLPHMPSNTDLLILRGYCLYQDQRGEEAVVFMERAAQVAADEFLPQYFHGWLLTQIGRHGDAVEPLENALVLLRADESEFFREYEPQVLVLLARCCLEKNLFSKGIRHLQTLRRFKHYGNGPELYNSLGVLWLKQQNYTNALDSFEEARSRSQSPVICQNIAVLYDLHLQSPDKARDYYIYSLAAASKINDTSMVPDIHRRLKQLAREH